MSVGTTSPESARKSVKRYADNPENAKKLAGKRRVETAIRNGSLKRPSKCPRCGRSGVRILFHHKNYDGDGLNGSFMCDRCHAVHDKKRSGKAMRKARAKAEATKKREGVMHKE